MDDLGIRISSVFTVLVGSVIGVSAPVIAKHIKLHRSRQHGRTSPTTWSSGSTELTKLSCLSSLRTNYSDLTFFCLKYVGSGVILATAFIHLLAPAHDALTDDKLSERWQSYPFAFALCMLMIFVTLFIEMCLIAHHTKHAALDESFTDNETITKTNTGIKSLGQEKGNTQTGSNNILVETQESIASSASLKSCANSDLPERSVSAQLSSLLFLEFGILFHSVFVGLTLAITEASKFKTLYVVIVFHQTFEGVGLGARIAAINWPSHKAHVEWLLVAAFGLITPLAIAIGLIIKTRFDPESPAALVASGVCDALAAGILIFSSLIELIAKDLLHDESLSFQQRVVGFIFMFIGSVFMAVLGIWA